MGEQGRPIVTITERPGPGIVDVALSGRLEVRTVPDVRLTLHRLLADGHEPLALDLEELELADASAVGLLVELHRRARRAGRPLTVVAATDRTRRLLVRARLHGMLPLAPPRPGPAAATS
ncbi:STAS domain-containing protein [Phycicoccus endophyticus]|uniref:STAS domain-containing protein n=1 Tax=Phycicoccus endophyticus TaxID=1690220 RepID=A0A7G9QYJ6_9MICO|nr:STAS domain-containing protein [Phycicoccus endophyticus]NHI19325.1 STAS domain-containing protein [Phycicoccus endophyticus]QNN48421.1 STAS domain-containing protein [Phycicoccus endophyticus]GGL41880.1 hypothetical protein GCM10012283_25600 [Phycicoccus endophyticus]